MKDCPEAFVDLLEELIKLLQQFIRGGPVFAHCWLCHLQNRTSEVCWIYEGDRE